MIKEDDFTLYNDVQYKNKKKYGKNLNTHNKQTKAILTTFGFDPEVFYIKNIEEPEIFYIYKKNDHNFYIQLYFEGGLISMFITYEVYISSLDKIKEVENDMISYINSINDKIDNNRLERCFVKKTIENDLESDFYVDVSNRIEKQKLIFSMNEIECKMPFSLNIEMSGIYKEKENLKPSRLSPIIAFATEFDIYLEKEDQDFLINISKDGSLFINRFEEIKEMISFKKDNTLTEEAKILLILNFVK